MFVYAMEDVTHPITKIGVSKNPEARAKQVGAVVVKARYEVADRFIANLIESMAHAFAIRKYGRSSVRTGDGRTEFFKCTVRQAMGFILRAYQLFSKMGYDALRSYRRNFCRRNKIRL
jgi:hypothetical protein